MANFHVDENAMMELVCATHNPDGTNFNSNVVLSTIETILNSEKVVDKVATEEMLEDFDLKFRELSLKIQHLCFEAKTALSSARSSPPCLSAAHSLVSVSPFRWVANLYFLMISILSCTPIRYVSSAG
nr:protein SIEVE ELEMENT OCCLUSION B-like [Ipomoea batatas]